MQRDSRRRSTSRDSEVREREYDEAVQRVHLAFCDPTHELVGEWDQDMADALRRGGYLIVKAERHPYQGDGESPCSEPCGGPEQGDPRHFTDGDG